MPTIYTIGFTQRSARDFFGTLKQTGIKQLLDIRLNNVSQLAGFSKKADLEYFLAEIVGAEYRHLPLLAPTQAILDRYKKEKGSPAAFEAEFLELMAQRRIEEALSPALFDDPMVLLCSEHDPAHCHRRLVLDYLNAHWGTIQAVHL